MAGVTPKFRLTVRVQAPRRLLALADDDRLIREMRRGNEAAFEVVYERYAGGLLALCRRILGSRDEAEEALQHSFAVVWSSLRRADANAPERLRPWLYAVARNHCLSLLRAREPSTVSLEEGGFTAELADEIERRADLRAVLGDLEELPEEHRSALLLSEIGGLSHAEIATVLGRQESAVKALVFQARSTLSDWREARDARCEEIRGQLSVLRGGALRRRALRRHVQTCPGCRQYLAEVRAQRRRLRLILPMFPLALERAALAASGGGGSLSPAGAGAGIGLATSAPLGSAVGVAVTAAVVGVLATGGPTTVGHELSHHPPRPLPAHARSTRLSSHATAARVGSSGVIDRQNLARDRQLVSGRRSLRLHRAKTPERRTLLTASSGATTASGSPTPTARPAAAADPQETAQIAQANRQEWLKIAQATEQEHNQIAQANQQRSQQISQALEQENKQIAQALVQEAQQIAQAQHQAAGKGSQAQQQEQQQIAQAKRHAAQQIAQARLQAAQPIAQANEHAAEQIAHARQQAAQQIAQAQQAAAQQIAQAKEQEAQRAATTNGGH